MALFLFCLFCAWVAGCLLSAHEAYFKSGLIGLLSEVLLIMLVQVLIAFSMFLGAIGYLVFLARGKMRSLKKKAAL